MEKLIYWIKRILHKKWKDCRSFCGVCKYYSDCRDEENRTTSSMNSDEKKDIHREGGSVVI